MIEERGASKYGSLEYNVARDENFEGGHKKRDEAMKDDMPGAMVSVDGIGGQAQDVDCGL